MRRTILRCATLVAAAAALAVSSFGSASAQTSSMPYDHQSLEDECTTLDYDLPATVFNVRSVAGGTYDGGWSTRDGKMQLDTDLRACHQGMCGDDQKRGLNGRLTALINWVNEKPGELLEHTDYGALVHYPVERSDEPVDDASSEGEDEVPKVGCYEWMLIAQDRNDVSRFPADFTLCYAEGQEMKARSIAVRMYRSTRHVYNGCCAKRENRNVMGCLP